MRSILKELPSWSRESEAQRAEWFNTIMAKLWPWISEAINKSGKNTMNPMFLNSLKSYGFDKLVSLKLQKFSLGDICPKIKSIRVHNTHESIVRMDVGTPHLSRLNPNLSQLNPNLSQLNPNLSQLNPNLS